MGALAPATYTWIPEDDLLLKNALEAGASLESLAKGAVKFSQRFNIQQIQERWRSLLYHPVISKEASARMTEFDPSAPKSVNRSAKRKPESIRKCYYSHRKRICNDPFTSTDLNFIDPPDNNNNNNNNDTINNNNTTTTTTTNNNNNNDNNNNSNSNNDFSNSNNDFSNSNNDDVVAGSENFVFFDDPIENQFRIGDPNFDTAVDHAFPDFGISDSTTNAFCNVENCIEDICMHQIPQNFDENLPLCDDLDPVNGFFEPGEFDQTNDNDLDFFSDFGCSPPLPDIPTWDTVDDICDPNFSCINFEDEEQQTTNTFILTGDNEVNNNNQSSAPSSTDEFLAELNNSLLNFDNDDELLLMDDNVKDTVDSYHSLLLGCPNETETVNIPVLEKPVNTGQVNEEQTEKGKNLNSHKSLFLRYRSTVNPEFPELRNGVICCVLNTEDQEIPCNDDVFLLSHISFESPPPWKIQESELPTYLPATDFYAGHKVNDYVPKMIRRQPFLTASDILGPQSVNPALDERRGNFGIQQSAFLRVTHSSNKSTSNLDPAKKTEIPVKGNIGCSNSADDIRIEKKDNGVTPNREQDLNNVAEAVTRRCDGLHAEAGPVEGQQHTVVEPPTQDHEAVSSEADEDDGVPCFSDIEAMILEMDLACEDSSTRDEMTSRFQDEETMKKIIRLESCVSSSMQRSLESESALAVLYGHDSKFFITQPEVLVGRSTDDVTVDIDIGRHHSYKISRRQAIIKLDNDGCFHLTNLGKHAIFVNGSAVASRQTLILPSGCLIDIRGIAFIFETCRRKVDEYLNKKGSET